MAFPAADAITAFRGIVQQAMPDAFEILRTTYAPDGYGGQTGTTGVTSTGICLLRALSGSELVTADKLTVTKPAAIDLPVGTDVTEKDQIRIGGARTFEVVAVVVSGAYSVKVTCIANDLQ